MHPLYSNYVPTMGYTSMGKFLCAYAGMSMGHVHTIIGVYERMRSMRSYEQMGLIVRTAPSRGARFLLCASELYAERTHARYGEPMRAAVVS